MINLRPVMDEDGERLFRWRREPEVDRWMSDLPAFGLDEHQFWFQGFLADADRRGWIINHNGAPAGFLSLTGVQSRHRHADWGWYIGEADARGRGAGRAAQALGLDVAFDGLGLEKV